ncbi:MAG: 30S ribosome-binding factor RbfA [Planctomycetota bacterium]|jgi:ribosome-binding factor A
MSSRRAQKVAEAVREVVSMAILAELQDPRIQDVTVTYVEVSGDLRHAKVHVSVMGDEKHQELSLRGLQSAAGFLQAKIARQIDLRYTPRLKFVLDQGVKRSIEISQILEQILPEQKPPDSGDSGSLPGEPAPDDVVPPGGDVPTG